MIWWSKIDPDAKPNSVLTTAENQPWADAMDLKTTQDAFDFSTACELNQTVLEGEPVPFPSEPASIPWGFFSSIQCGLDGMLTPAPVLDISFVQDGAPFAVSSNGITLYFCDSYPTNLSIEWYNGETLLDTATFAPDGLVYLASRTVRSYTRVKLTFQKGMPFRYIKLYRIEYGQLLQLTRSDLVRYSITENVNECATKIVVNTAQIELFAKGVDFHLVTNAGDYDLIKSRQPIEDLEGYGTFYINQVEGENSSLSLNLVDLLGIIGEKKFYGGMYDTTFSAFVAELADAAGTSDIFSGRHNGFEIDAAVAEIPVSGYVPVTTVREALQMACIACCVVADASRSDKIRLRAKSTEKIQDIGPTVMEQRAKTVLNRFYTGVSVTAYSYSQESNTKEIFTTEYAPGSYTVEFSSPYTSVSVSGATIESSGINYVKFTVSNAGTVTARGRPFVETKQEVEVQAPDTRGAVESLKTLDRNTLVNPDNADRVAQNYLDYFTHKYKSEYRTLTPYRTGEIYQANYVTGILEKQTIDRITELSKAVLYGDYQPDHG